MLYIPWGTKVFTLIPSESRRLIAKAVAQMEEIKLAWEKAYVILNGGTTNGYIAQELLGMEEVEPQKFTAGTNTHRLLCVIDSAKRIPFPIIVYKGEKSGKTFDLIIEATGSSSGLHLALTLVRPKGHIVLKSTIHGETAVDISRIVVDELVLTGSRCGPFDRSIQLLEKKLIRVEEMVDREYRLDQASEAFVFAEDSEVLKVLLVP